MNALNDTDGTNQMIHFITGEAGTGKSKVIRCLLERIRLKYGKTKGRYGCVLSVAPSGIAAKIFLDLPGSKQ